MMDIHQKNSERIDNQRSRKEEIMAKFILAVSEEFRTQRQVAYYARKFYITPKHLSAVVKEISGRTAGDWIENYVVMEAKVLLKTTDKTIQEITLMLNFATSHSSGNTSNTTPAYPQQHTVKNSPDIILLFYFL